MARQHTFLFADLAGFTALTEAHGDQEAAELAGRFFEEVRGLLSEHGAEEVKTIGDAVMVRCDDPERAVCLGLHLVEEIGGRPEFPSVRVGLHTGPAVARQGDWFGAAVNLAARISGAAAGGEVLLSEGTREAAGEMTGIELRDRGTERFHNVSRPVRLFHAVREGDRRSGLPVDPVCRMAVDPSNDAGSLVHEGIEYRFCSLECARAFASAPEAYANPG